MSENLLKAKYLTGNPDFDVFFYKSVYNDLCNMNIDDLIYHYIQHGQREGRKYSNKQVANIMGIPDFDILFYKYYNTDLTYLSCELLMEHYNLCGKYEGRLYSEEQLNNYIEIITGEPDFDPDFYTNYYPDLKHMSNIEACKHYIEFGKKEGRIISEKNFLAIYPDFDIDFYRKFNSDLPENLNNIELMRHYSDIGYYANIRYFEYDYIVNDDYTLNNDIIDDKTKHLIYNHEPIRRIDNYNDLLEYNKKFEKKYYISNKETFYKYYNDFDYEYYKNRYFKNKNNINEKDILYFYHTKGKSKQHITNKKINIILYIPSYQDRCGGIVVMHYFCKLINTKYNENFCAKIFMHNNLTYSNPFCNNFARIDEINNNTIVIYPEVISGNPLNAKNVVRWILLELGIEMPIDHYKKWNKTDLIYHWEKIDKQLCCPFFNNIFSYKNSQQRDKSCYLIKKGPLIHKNINYIHPSDSICIDNLSLYEINDIFNKCKFFYTYDADTAYIIYAAVCGCIPIIYEIDGVSEEEYFTSKMFNFENNIYNRGIVYGNNIEKINYILENKLNKNNEEYYRNLFTMIEEKTIQPFLNKIINYNI
jgi:hypothetical protein